MKKLAEHPTVVRIGQRPKAPPPPTMTFDELRRLALDAGADDVGVVSADRSALEEELPYARAALPSVRTFVAFVIRMSPSAVRTPARSIANLEFHHTGDRVNDVGRAIAAALEARGHRAINPSMGFPMEMDNFPDRMWVVAHKTVAVEAGLGQMGIHRNLIHPKFGNFILLGTVITDLRIDAQSHPIDYNPCLECKLCVAACPVGAIGADGYFDFSACYNHNYREFMGGFTDWVATIADSDSAVDYRSRVRESESASMWQSLSYGANYKAAYCMAVCPAGEDVIGPYLDGKAAFLEQTVKPLTTKEEPVYVVPTSDAEAHLKKRFPHKEPRPIRSALRAETIEQFLFGLTLLFQRKAASDLKARYHFDFTGAQAATATVVIDEGTLEVTRELEGDPDVSVRVDGQLWLDLLKKRRSMVWAVITRQLKVKGSLSLLKRFSAVFLAD